MSIKNAYLALYNSVMSLGWGAVAVLVIQHWIAGRKSAEGGEVSVYEVPVLDKQYPGLLTIGKLAGYCQVAALMETVHAATGVVRSSAAANALQWFARWHALLCVVQPVPQIHPLLAVDVMLIAWGLGDIMRYPWYAVQAATGSAPYWMTWLRYSAFIVLWPLGAGMEMVCLYYARPFIQEANLYGMNLPNAFNFGYPEFLAGGLFLYPPALGWLYMSVLASRKAKLSPKEKEKAK